METHTVTFSDGKTFTINTDQFNRSTRLVENDGRSSRLSETFNDFIYPILCGYEPDTIRALQTKSDLTCFIDEIKYYEIVLSPREIHLACTKCGLLNIITSVKGWFRKHAEETADGKDIKFKRFHGKKKTQYINFVYNVQKMFKKMYDVDIDGLNVASLYESIFHETADKLSLTNWNSNNALYEMCEVFDTVIVRKQIDSGFYLDFSASVTINADNALSSITSAITKLFE